jgi:hypothetical protein
MGHLDDIAIVFPRIEDFNFDKKKYHHALDFLREHANIDYRKKVSKEQADRLYPQDQP